MLRIKIILWTLMAPWSLRKIAFNPLPRNPKKEGAPEELIAAADEVLLARFCGKLIFRTRCLKRTYVLYKTLRHRGHDATAYIGLQKNGKGHAWLEVDGHKVADPVFTPPVEFTPFVKISDSIEYLKG